ncbi:MAG: S9 family peptidase [Saprospiraceae bacterium]
MSNIQPPKADKITHVDTINGVVMSDDYYWLRDDKRTNEKVLNYLKAENTYMESVTAHTKDLQEELFKEMVGRINETDLSVPVEEGGYFYYSRTEKGKNYPIYCRKKGNLEASEEILLDGNELAEGKKYFSLGTFEVSPDHKTLAYGMDTDGSEYYDIYFKNLETGELLSDKITRTGGTLAWGNDNKTVFYTMLDDAHRPYRLHRMQLGNPSLNLMVYEETDDRYFLSAYRTKSGQYIMMYLGSKITTEIQYLNADNPMDLFKKVTPREQGVEYSVTHHGDKFYIKTNENALNFKVMTVDAATPAKSNWKPFITHDDNVLVSSVEAFENHLLIYTRKNGLKNITVYDLKTGENHDIKFPEAVYTYFGSDNPEFNSTTFRMTYSSLITPRTVYDYDMNTREFIEKKVYEVKGGYEKSDYATERIMATAPDGTQVPLSISYRKGLKRDGENPCYLYGYGSYGSNMDPYFSTIRLSLMDRGYVFAMAHVRGGSEMGRKWYEDGKFLNKKNTFTDFIACAEILIKEKYTTSDKLAISGGSAGGLLMGAVTNLRPELFKVVVADVPFVDVMNTMLDETIPLTVTEYEEWGNPNEKKYFDYMLSYSPYDNVEKKDYPNMLITGGLNDPRVQYWEPAKWAAKLRDYKTDDNTLVLKTNMGAGHGGASGRYERIKEMAFEYSFVIDKIGTREIVKD